MKFLCLFLILIACLPLSIHAQTNATIRNLEAKRGGLQKDIAQKEQVLGTTSKDVRTKLQNLSTLNAQISERKNYIDGIMRDVDTINIEMRKLQHSLDSLEQQLTERKDKYAKSLKHLYRARQMHEKLMFIFASSSLGEAYRRSRYLQDYAAYQKVLAGAITQQQAKIKRKQQEFESVQKAKRRLLAEGQDQQEKLEAQQKEQQQLVTQLQKQQREITAELTRQRREAQKLNAEIDRLIAIEVEKARKRAAEEAARKRAEAERAAKAAAAAREKTTTSKGTTTKESTTTTKAPVPKMADSKASSADAKLSGTFANNKGRLPMPITGSYLITERYGVHSVAGLKGGAQLDNKGITIQGQAGAQARSVFDGEVTSIFQVSGLFGIIVRHGSYLSTYYGISSVSVRSGQQIKTGQTLGTVFSDSRTGGRSELQFRLHKEQTKLNPEQWLKR